MRKRNGQATSRCQSHIVMDIGIILVEENRAESLACGLRDD